MQNLTLQNYTESDLDKLADFCSRYLKKYPDAKLNSPDFYTYHPGFKNGENVLCVFDSGQRMIGFAPVFPVLVSDENDVISLADIWTVILTSPDCEAPRDVRDILFNGVLKRVYQAKMQYSLFRLRLCADLMVSQKEDIDYLLSKGFESFEQMVVMNRDLSETIETISTPDEIVFQASKLSSKDEQSIYLKIHNTCFPENPKNTEDLGFLLKSPLWEKGVALMAYSPTHELVGSVLVYWDGQQDYAVMDDVMVDPAWRGQNIAKGLIGEGLRYIQTDGLSVVRIEVKVSNPAVNVYTSMGFRVLDREELLAKYF